MNKPIILALSIVAALAIIGLSIWGLLRPANSVRLVLPDGVDSITIDGSTKKTNQRLGIRPGEYTYTLSGENIDDSEREIVIEADMDELEITYAPYSSEHLDELLDSQREEIVELVNREYVSQVDDYHIQELRLLDRGQFAAVLITPVDIDTNNPANVYRLLLKKSNDSWQTAAGPELLLTTTNTKSIDKHILQEINGIDLAL